MLDQCHHSSIPGAHRVFRVGTNAMSTSGFNALQGQGRQLGLMSRRDRGNPAPSYHTVELLTQINRQGATTSAPSIGRIVALSLGWNACTIFDLTTTVYTFGHCIQHRSGQWFKLFSLGGHEAGQLTVCWSAPCNGWQVKVP